MAERKRSRKTISEAEAAALAHSDETLRLVGLLGRVAFALLDDGDTKLYRQSLYWRLREAARLLARPRLGERAAEEAVGEMLSSEAVARLARKRAGLELGL